MMNRMEYDKRLKEMVREANDIRLNYQGSYWNYLHAVRTISQFKKGNRMESCEPCEGKGKVKDSTGFFPIRCIHCNGTGKTPLTVPEETVKMESPLLSRR